MAKSDPYRDYTKSKHTGLSNWPCRIEHRPRMAIQRFHALDTRRDIAEERIVLGANDMVDVLVVSGMVYLQHATWRAFHSEFA